MRYAIISDIHANIEALDAVLDTVDGLEVDQILCCGDLVGYLASPNECVERIRERRIATIAGNHDLAAAGMKRLDSFWDVARQAIIWTRRQLSSENAEFLRSLPGIMTVDDRVLLFHGALHPATAPEDLHLESEEDIRQSFATMTRRHPSIRVAFFGHLHVPCVYRMREDAVEILDPRRLRLEADSHYLVNPGSVGLSRDSDPNPAFALYDAETGEIEFHRVIHSHVTATARADQAGLTRPGWLLWFLRKCARKLCKLVGCADVDY